MYLKDLKSKMPIISIIIPIYNVEKYLRQALDSLVNQVFTDFEVICVDDGSKDNSSNIIDEYRLKDSRFYKVSQKNSGAGIARNNGLKQAKGKYVLFLDADDYFEKDLLKVLYEQAELNNADISVCSSRKVDEIGNVIETKNPNSPLNLAKLKLNKVFNYDDYSQDIFSLI